MPFTFENKSRVNWTNICSQLQRRHEQMRRSLEQQVRELEEKRRAFEAEKLSWEQQTGHSIEELRRRSLEANSKE